MKKIIETIHASREYFITTPPCIISCVIAMICLTFGNFNGGTATYVLCVLSLALFVVPAAYCVYMAKKHPLKQEDNDTKTDKKRNRFIVKNYRRITSIGESSLKNVTFIIVAVMLAVAYLLINNCRLLSGFDLFLITVIVEAIIYFKVFNRKDKENKNNKKGWLSNIMSKAKNRYAKAKEEAAKKTQKNQDDFEKEQEESLKKQVEELGKDNNDENNNDADNDGNNDGNDDDNNDGNDDNNNDGNNADDKPEDKKEKRHFSFKLGKKARKNIIVAVVVVAALCGAAFAFKSCNDKQHNAALPEMTTEEKVMNQLKKCDELIGKEEAYAQKLKEERDQLKQQYEELLKEKETATTSPEPTTAATTTNDTTVVSGGNDVPTYNYPQSPSNSDTPVAPVQPSTPAPEKPQPTTTPKVTPAPTVKPENDTTAPKLDIETKAMLLITDSTAEYYVTISDKNTVKTDINKISVSPKEGIFVEKYKISDNKVKLVTKFEKAGNYDLTFEEGFSKDAAGNKSAKLVVRLSVKDKAIIEPTKPVTPAPTTPVSPEPTKPVTPQPTEPAKPEPTEPQKADTTKPVVTAKLLSDAKSYEEFKVLISFTDNEKVNKVNFTKANLTLSDGLRVLDLAYKTETSVQLIIIADKDMTKGTISFAEGIVEDAAGNKSDASEFTFDVASYAKPEVSEEPKTTEQPKTTEEPKTTEQPKTTEEPKTTDQPKTSEEPKTTEQPKTTEEPITTQVPESPKPTVTPEEKLQLKLSAPSKVTAGQDFQVTANVVKGSLKGYKASKSDINVPEGIIVKSVNQTDSSITFVLSTDKDVAGTLSFTFDNAENSVTIEVLPSDSTEEPTTKENEKKDSSNDTKKETKSNVEEKTTEKVSEDKSSETETKKSVSYNQEVYDTIVNEEPAWVEEPIVMTNTETQTKD